MWLFWILLILIIVWAVGSALGKPGAQSSQKTSSLEILKQRYARGEIDQQEFEQKRKDLEV
jgi:putative membrane protein